MIAPSGGTIEAAMYGRFDAYVYFEDEPYQSKLVSLPVMKAHLTFLGCQTRTRAAVTQRTF
jgi:hypothetical protein